MIRSRKLVRSIGGIAAFCALAAGFLLATARTRGADTCALTGYVVDPYGYGVVGAQVQIYLPGGDSFQATTDNLGAYVLSFPASSLGERAALFVQLGQTKPVFAGHAVFRGCRSPRNVLVNAATVALTPGPAVPPGPGVPPPYPPPIGPPPDAVADAVVYLDPSVVPTDRLAIGDIVRLPLCLSQRAGPAVSVARVQYASAFDPRLLRVLNIDPVTGTLGQTDVASFDNLDGELVYAARSAVPAALPPLTGCARIAEVDVQVVGNFAPGDMIIVASLDGTKMWVAGSDSPAAPRRTTTYLDIVPPAVRLYLPILFDNAPLPP